jgi:hypothetical protein
MSSKVTGVMSISFRGRPAAAAIRRIGISRPS